MAGHAQLKFVITECPKTQIRLTGLKSFSRQTIKEANQTNFKIPFLIVSSVLKYELRQANLCLRAFRHDKF